MRLRFCQHKNNACYQPHRNAEKVAHVAGLSEQHNASCSNDDLVQAACEAVDRRS